MSSLRSSKVGSIYDAGTVIFDKKGENGLSAFLQHRHWSIRVQGMERFFLKARLGQGCCHHFVENGLRTSLCGFLIDLCTHYYPDHSTNPSRATHQHPANHPRLSGSLPLQPDRSVSLSLRQSLEPSLQRTAHQMRIEPVSRMGSRPWPLLGPASQTPVVDRYPLLFVYGFGRAKIDKGTEGA
ncbi:hypothetical protein K457DRAFT_129989 [Linnemannia elongata AG-77]|uniref:Uncharacterized protein n=1 Tax=Linnemannia elongata AG-77 TaxID=1314771 RepID=A0A197JI82_9FUNG|nr:hypothetical protein K457DRAFT_129989 [Linnemannia elongata AG-77]